MHIRLKRAIATPDVMKFYKWVDDDTDTDVYVIIDDQVGSKSFAVFTCHLQPPGRVLMHFLWANFYGAACRRYLATRPVNLFTRVPVQ